MGNPLGNSLPASQLSEPRATLKEGSMQGHRCPSPSSLEAQALARTVLAIPMDFTVPHRSLTFSLEQILNVA